METDMTPEEIQSELQALRTQYGLVASQLPKLEEQFSLLKKRERLYAGAIEYLEAKQAQLAREADAAAAKEKTEGTNNATDSRPGNTGRRKEAAAQDDPATG